MVHVRKRILWLSDIIEIMNLRSEILHCGKPLLIVYLICYSGTLDINYVY